jgi:predicted GNAT family acetyltransferase
MEILNNKRTSTFEALLPDGEMATLVYRWLKGSMVLMHTFVPANHRGEGIGDVLVKHVLDYARDHELKIMVYCPFVEKYMREHSEYNDLLANVSAG